MTMTKRHGEPLNYWGLEPCGDLGSPTSFCAHWRRRPPLRARRTRSDAGAAFLGSSAAVYHSWRSGVAPLRPLWSKKHVKETSSAASPPEEVGVDHGLGRDHYVRAFGLSYLSGGQGHPGSYSLHFWSGLIKQFGANTFTLWDSAKTHESFRTRQGNRLVIIGASGGDNPPVSGDPIQAPFR